MGVEDLFGQSEFALWIEGFANSLEAAEEARVGRRARFDVRGVGGGGVNCCETSCTALAEEICCRALFEGSIDCRNGELEGDKYPNSRPATIQKPGPHLECNCHD